MTEPIDPATAPIDPPPDPISESPAPSERPAVLWASPDQRPYGSEGSGKSRPVAALLAFILGGIGIHKFYLGKTVLGVIYLIFFWTGIPALIAWVEGISYLATSDESWAQRYGGPVAKAKGAAIGCLWIVALGPLLLTLGIVALIFLGSQVGSIDSMGLGTGGSGCELTNKASSFAPGNEIRMTAEFSPPLPAGVAVTVHMTGNGSEVAGYPQTLALDVATECVSGTLSADPLPAGHYVITVTHDGAVMPPLTGEFEVTP